MAHGFGSLNDAHAELGELFLVHQECLLIGEIALAREVLAAYRSALRLHMQHEEELVMPIYLRAESPRWPEELYTGQHEKLLALLDRVEAALTPLDRAGVWRRAVIEVLEIETSFKHLVDHHHLAEDQAFYPTADAESTEAERARIVEACRAQFTAASTASRDVVERARRSLEADGARRT